MKKKWYLVGAAVPLVVAILMVILGLCRLSKPDPAQIMLYMGYSAEEDNGWSFETELGPAQPQMGFGGYFEGIAAENEGPVAASRIMEDPGMRNLLEFSYYGMGIQVFLDDSLLYTDFPNMENSADAFLKDVDASAIERETLHISLPYDCAGRTLRVVSYGQLWDGCRPVTFPSLVSRFSDAIVMSSDTVWDLAAATVLALLSVLLLLIFLLGEHTGQRQWKLLPLAAYFLFAVFPLIRNSFAGVAAGLDKPRFLMEFISLCYIDFLVIFLSMEMNGWKRDILLAACAAHLLLSLMRTLWNFPVFPDGALQDPAGWVLMAFSLILLIFSGKEKKILRWSAASVAVAAAAMFALWGFVQGANVEALYYLANPVNALLSGDPRAFYRIICAIVSVLCVAGVVTRFIQEYIFREKREQSLMLRNRMAQESYTQMVDSINKTASMRHEWRNQIISLQLLQRQGKMDALEQELTALDAKLNQLMPKHFCNHFTINSILQNAAARAESFGVRFNASALVPQEIGIADNDLCSLLLNMLDNALEAAAQMPESNSREVKCAIRTRNGYLAVKCENSYSGVVKLNEQGELQTTKPDAETHGFGLVQMGKIAEKYGSVLDVSYTNDCFTVQTALKME